MESQYIFLQIAKRTHTNYGTKGNSDMKKKQIKTCPFCGEDAKLKRGRLSFVECQNCFAQTGLYKTDEEAIEAWEERKG